MVLLGCGNGSDGQERLFLAGALLAPCTVVSVDEHGEVQNRRRDGCKIQAWAGHEQRIEST